MTDPIDAGDEIDRNQDPAWGFVSPGEHRGALLISLVAVIGLQVALPDRITLGPWWMFPALEAGMLVLLTIANPTRLDAESRDVRELAIGLVLVVIIADGSTLFLLMRKLLAVGFMVQGRTLIFSAVGVWVTSIQAFGMLYWELDRGGPIKRCTPDHDAPDLLFPQMNSPTSTAQPWHPRFVDYLYVSLTNSMAFSPTDALPLTRRLKGIMAVQSVASLITIVVVGARAVNILA
ncbi:MAG: hypothetical protein JWM34_2076 [Ilumatobacteraceae bacterium]|nr:hypothetical protein [Ilumatobacteraceae bacterium]